MADRVLHVIWIFDSLLLCFKLLLVFQGFFNENILYTPPTELHFPVIDKTVSLYLPAVSTLTSPPSLLYWNIRNSGKIKVGLLEYTPPSILLFIACDDYKENPTNLASEHSTVKCSSNYPLPYFYLR